MSSITRRTIVLGAAAAVATSGALAQSPPASRLSRVTVDVSALEAKGLGPFARLLAAATRDALQAQFADRLGTPGAPALVVRLTSLLMPSFTGSDAIVGGGGRFGSGGASHDYLEGEALIVDARGGVLDRYPLLTNLPSSYAGAWYDPQIDRKRLVALSAAFASWVRRRFG